MVLNVTLKFCRNDAGGSSSCCDAAADAALQAQFDAMDVKPADGECARLVKSILCSVRTTHSGLNQINFPGRGGS